MLTAKRPLRALLGAALASAAVSTQSEHATHGMMDTATGGAAGMGSAVGRRMAQEKAVFRGRGKPSVKAMTPPRHRHVAVACVLAGVAVAAGCGSSEGDVVDESWTSRPSPVDGDGGNSTSDARADGSANGSADGGADAYVEPDPGPLCTLTGPPAPTSGDVLVFADEFDGTSVNTSNWNIANSYKGHATIANTANPANDVVSDGTLKIVTDRDPSNATYPYVSGYIDSLGRYARTYGKIEFRARFPYAGGVWYAIWGRPWSQSFPELDIELVNRPTSGYSEMYFVNHWAAPPLPADDRRSYVMFKDMNFDVFRNYTLMWTPDSLTWSVDGVLKLTAKPQGIPNLPVYWIINGWVGGWVGDPTASTPFPNTFEVDYMRVYRVDGLIADPLIKIVNQRTKYAATDNVEVAIANFDEACAHVEMYDGETLLRTTSTAPFKFPLGRLQKGAHTLTFAATDGVRRTTFTFDTQVN